MIIYSNDTLEITRGNEKVIQIDINKGTLPPELAISETTTPIYPPGQGPMATPKEFKIGYKISLGKILLSFKTLSVAKKYFSAFLSDMPTDIQDVYPEFSL